jgi:hypothetical protein
MGIRLMGVFALIPSTVLLTISFFVLVVARKVESHALKVFGYVVAAFLWASVAAIASAGLLTIATGRMPCPLMAKMAHPPMGACSHGPDAGGMQMPR